MSKLNIRLPQFLSEVDALTANMSQGELQAFVHEMARTWSEKGGQSFVELLKTPAQSAIEPSSAICGLVAYIVHSANE